jgi:hypothetical protein
MVSIVIDWGVPFIYTPFHTGHPGQVFACQQLLIQSKQEHRSVADEALGTFKAWGAHF